MAHALTRIEGFELNNFSHLLGDTNVLGSIQGTIKRSGDYACRILNDGVSACRIAVCINFDSGGTTNGSVAVAMSYRFWVYLETYPSVAAIVWGLKGAGAAARSDFTMSTTGVLTLDGVAGTTALPLLTWCEVVGIYDSTGAGTHSVQLDIDDGNGRQQEFTNVAPTNGDTILTLVLGKTGTSGSYSYVVDDIAIESAADIALIDYPAPGNIIGLDLDGDGGINGYTWVIAGSSPPATRWEASNRPHDGNISHIGVSNIGKRKQTFTLEDSAVAGLGSIINAVMFCQVCRSTGAATSRILAGSSNFSTTGVGAVTVMTAAAALSAGSTFNFIGSMHQTNPFTLAAWSTDDLDGLVIGVQTAPGGGSIYRLSTASVMVDSQVEAGMAVNSTFLQQAQYPLGLLRSVTNYRPELKTIRLTSESYGVPNEVFNIIACSIRHVPQGVGVVRGVWSFDQQATAAFLLANNPLRDAVMRDTVENSSFLLDESLMVDGQQVYTEYVRIEGQGKIFELSLSQEGSNCMEVLAIDFELLP